MGAVKRRNTREHGNQFLKNGNSKFLKSGIFSIGISDLYS